MEKNKEAEGRNNPSKTSVQLLSQIQGALLLFAKREPVGSLRGGQEITTNREAALCGILVVTVES